MAQLGVEHPFIRTEYELIELDGEGGLFPSSRRGQMAGEHEPLARGVASETYALLDVAGEEEDQVEGVKAYDPTARRDSTALTVVRVGMDGERPRFDVVRRYLWTGVKHTKLYDQIRDLAKSVWRARYVVVNATGIGAGLASFLRAGLKVEAWLGLSRDYRQWAVQGVRAVRRSGGVGALGHLLAAGGGMHV